VSMNGEFRKDWEGRRVGLFLGTVLSSNSPGKTKGTNSLPEYCHENLSLLLHKNLIIFPLFWWL
jgi:hypothetical protein